MVGYSNVELEESFVCEDRLLREEEAAVIRGSRSRLVSIFVWK